MIRPFIVLALPRSRTFWLSKFLTYGDWHCGHDELRHVRSLEDAASWLNQPCTGTVETAAAPFWRLIPTNVRVVVVRRTVEQVCKSLMNSMPPGVFNQEAMTKLMEKQEIKLSQVLKRWPNAFVVNFNELQNETICAGLFEYCLPYKHDPQWWRGMSSVNLQISMPEFMRYIIAHKPQINRAAMQAKVATILTLQERNKWRSL